MSINYADKTLLAYGVAPTGRSDGQALGYLPTVNHDYYIYCLLVIAEIQGVVSNAEIIIRSDAGGAYDIATCAIGTTAADTSIQVNVADDDALITPSSAVPQVIANRAEGTGQCWWAVYGTVPHQG